MLNISDDKKAKIYYSTINLCLSIAGIVKFSLGNVTHFSDISLTRRVASFHKKEKENVAG